MERRQFLSLTFGAIALAAVPASVRAEDFRKSKPTAWKAKTVDDALKALYGSTNLVMKGVNLTVANVKSTDTSKKGVASNGGAVPVDFSTKLDVKTITVLQDVNPESAVAVYNVTPYSVNKYSIKMKMKKSGSVYVVAEGKDGKLYAAKQTIDVALGGCEG